MDRSKNGGELAIAIIGDDRELRERVTAVLEAAGYSRIDAAARRTQLPPIAGTRDCTILAARKFARDSLDTIAEAAAAGELVVVVYGSAQPRDLRAAVTRGALGTVDDARLDQLLAIVVQAISLGQICIPRDHSQAFTRRPLTNREKQLLGLVVMGLTNAQIAAKLYLAESTVKSHLSSAFEKLGVSSRHEAAELVLDPELGRNLGILTIATPLSISG